MLNIKVEPKTCTAGKTFHIWNIIHGIHEMVAIEVPSKYLGLWAKYVDIMYIIIIIFRVSNFMKANIKSWGLDSSCL